MKTKTLHRLFTAVLTGTLLFGGTQLVFANELEDIQNAGVIKVGVEGLISHIHTTMKMEISLALMWM